MDDEIRIRKSTVGDFLKKSRIDSELTQSDVAKALGYTGAQFVSNWERGLSLPPMDVFPRLSHMYKVSPKAILSVVGEYHILLAEVRNRELKKLFVKKNAR